MTAPDSPAAPPPGAGDLGSATIEPGGAVVAGSYGTWRLTFRCAGTGEGGGETRQRAGRGIATGGGVRLYTDSDTDWGRPQVHDPAGAEYLTVEGPPEAVLGLTVVDEKSLVVTVLGAPLASGDAFTVTIGDRRGGGPGSRAQTFAEARRVFRLDVDASGSGDWTPLPDPPELAIVGGQAERLVLVAPSTVLPGEPFRLLVRAADAWGNPAHSWAGTVTLQVAGGAGALHLPQTAHDFGPQDGGVWWLEGCTVAAPGLYRIQARAEHGAHGAALLARSNPVLCPQRPGPYRLYWGDPHGGQIADAGKIPDFFRYARDVAGIDFAGYQRNDHVHSNADYAAQQRAEREFAAPGRFVPLPGFEWSAEPPMGGHHNVYFRRHGLPMRRNSHRGVADTSDAAGDLPHVRDLHRAYRGTDTIITPHVGGGHADLSHHESALEPALEISSTHGSFEWFFRESLARGYRMGVVGGSDSHDGRPGADAPGHQERRYAQGALTALLAERLTLESVHEALRARRCYATTGARILLHCSADGHLIGEAYRSGAAPTLTVDVTGTAPLESVTLYRGLDVLHEHPLPRRLATRRLRLLWEGASRETSYSGVIWDGELRLLGASRAGPPDGGRDGGPGATLGPPARLRFDSPRSHVLEHTPTSLRWHSVTCGYRSGLEVDLLLDTPGDLLGTAAGDASLEAPRALDGPESLDGPASTGASGTPGGAGGDVEAECVLRSALISRPDFGGHGDRGPSRMASSPAEAVSFRFRLSDVARRPLRVPLGDLQRSVTVSLAPAPGNPESARFTFVDPAPRPGHNPYWVRVVQEDQEMAWSSPVFLDYVAPGAG